MGFILVSVRNFFGLKLTTASCVAFRLLQNRILHLQTFLPRTFLHTFFLCGKIKWQIGSRKTLPRYELAFYVKSWSWCISPSDFMMRKTFLMSHYNFHSPPMFISKLLFYSICREIVGMSPYFNYVSMILLIFDQLSNLVCNFIKIPSYFYWPV